MLSAITQPHSLIRLFSLSFSQNRRIPASSATAVAPHPRYHSLICRSSSVPPPSLDQPITTGDDDNELASDSDDAFEIEIEKVGGKRNRRRIRSTIGVDAELDTVWRVLTDYEGLARFIPSVAVSRILDRKDKFAKLYQVGEQNLALGVTFKAKGVIDCYEGDLEISELSRRRDIEFKMAEGDFQTFEGRWSIQQSENEDHEDKECLSRQKFKTTLSYAVELEPKLWLPVRLLEGRLCREIRCNLQCISEEAQRVQIMGNEAPFDLFFMQSENEDHEDKECLSRQKFQTTLSYAVELEPKLWLPVRLLEGRLCREIRSNLQCISEEAQRVQIMGNEAPFDLGETENIVAP